MSVTVKVKGCSACVEFNNCRHDEPELVSERRSDVCWKRLPLVWRTLLAKFTIFPERVLSRSDFLESNHTSWYFDMSTVGFCSSRKRRHEQNDQKLWRHSMRRRGPRVLTDARRSTGAVACSWHH